MCVRVVMHVIVSMFICVCEYDSGIEGGQFVMSLFGLMLLDVLGAFAVEWILRSLCRRGPVKQL